MGRAIESIWQIVISAPLLLPAAIVVTTLVSVGTVYLSDFLPISMAEAASRADEGLSNRLPYVRMLPLHLLQLGWSIVTAAIMAIPCVIVSRHILLEEMGFRTPAMSVLWRYMAWSSALSTLTFASSQVGYFSDGWWTAYVPAIIGFALLLPLSLVFPGIAVNDDYASVLDRAQGGLRHLRGNFWLLLRVSLILRVVAYTVQELLVFLSVLFPQSLFNKWGDPTGWPVLTFQAAFIVFFSSLNAAMLAWAYAWAVPRPQLLDNFD